MQNTTANSLYMDASKMLQQKKEDLVAAFFRDRNFPFLEHYSRLLDDYFHDSFEKSMVGPKLGIIKNPYAIIALGGYGRQEQCIHSDVDLLILFKKAIPEEAEGLIREMVYPLWDIGLDMGYATRSLSECIQLAGKDYEVLTSLLDARFICGMSPLYSEMMEELRKKVIFRRSDKIVSWLIERNRERHACFGDSTYLLEPNLKEGQGGLRDYHTMLWLSHVKYELKSPRDLEYFGILSHQEFNRLKASLQFIWNVRSCLHHLTGKKYDQLHFEYQKQLAEMLQYDSQDGLQPVEKFLSELHGRMNFIKQKHQIFMYELGPANKRFLFKRPVSRQSKIEGLDIKKGLLNFVSPEYILRSPILLIKIFEESARLKIPLRGEAKRLVHEFSYLLDPIADDISVIKSFERILVAVAPHFNVLNDMLNTGILIRIIPEMQGIVNRIEYDEYHVHPVDKHLLRTVRILKQFGTSDDPTMDQLCGDLYNELHNRKLLLWASLLHDIGKMKPGVDHCESGVEIVEKILQRKQFKPRDVETVSFLVREHLFLVNAATRRDINDEETVICCARKIKDIERLKMLYLLSVADSIATGPKAWNDWKAALLRELFFKVLGILEKRELATEEAVEIAEIKKKEVIQSHNLPAEELETLFMMMSPRYLFYMEAADIRHHIRLFTQLKNNDFIWEIEKPSGSDTRTVTVCAKDRPGLFSNIAGIFTLNGINILEAQVHKWRNHVALYIFQVTPPPDRIFEKEKWNNAHQNLNAALNGELNLAEALDHRMDGKKKSYFPRTTKKPSEIIIDNESSGFFTIVEVYTHDFPGLLFQLTNALFKCKLEIYSAQIATKVDQVVDVFYVRDFDGQKVDSPDQAIRIKNAVAKVLPDMSVSPDTL